MRVVPEVMGSKEEQLESAVVRGAGRWEHCGCHVSVMSWKNAICGSVLVDVRGRDCSWRTEESVPQPSQRGVTGAWVRTVPVFKAPKKHMDTCGE